MSKAPGFLARTVAVLLGVVLGMAVVAGASPWRELLRKPEPAPSAPIQRERAPDLRVQAPETFPESRSST
jgi:hypothetical protein